MKQEERRQQTTGVLLTSTKELIREKGCEAITMKDIMDRSGLSKGAIFHYVKSKDEIFAWVLQERLDTTNERFQAVVQQGGATFEGPMQKILENLRALDDAQEVTNKVLIYLLGKEDQPAVAETLKLYYERSVQVSKEWIVTGQSHGVIPESVDADKTADLFVLLSLGLRVRSTIPMVTAGFQLEDFARMMTQLLKK